MQVTHTPKEEQSAARYSLLLLLIPLLSEFQNRTLLEGRRLSLIFFSQYLWVVCKIGHGERQQQKNRRPPKKGKSGCEVYGTEASGSVCLLLLFHCLDRIRKIPESTKYANQQNPEFLKDLPYNKQIISHHYPSSALFEGPYALKASSLTH